jgi:replicative DNA helicase
MAKVQPLPQATLDEQAIDDAVLRMESRLEKLPPQSLEAEQALLGGLLIDSQAYYKVVDLLAPEHFYRYPHQLIYEAMLALITQREPVDIITVCETLEHLEHLETVGGRAYISDLAASVLTTENIDNYAKLIRNKALLRQLITIGSSIVGLAYDSQHADAAIDKAQGDIFQLAQQGITNTALTQIAQVLPTVFTQIEERVANKGTPMGVPTGYYDLDMYTSGFQRSDLIILAARPSMGKTAFCLNIAANVALRANEPVLIFSLEMSKEQLVQRMLCAEAEIDAQRIRSGEVTEHDFGRLAMAMGKLGDSPVYIDDTPGLTVMELRAKARRIQTQLGKPLGMVVIDYLQLMEGSGSQKAGDNRTLEISAISRGLKATARELSCPVMALSQLSRAVESRQDKKPMLSDLRESGSIEQDADIVMFIYRDEYYNKETERPGTADIIIAKQRNGPVGEVSLLFRHNITKFVNPLDSARMVH